jgi:ABC-2 type transport system ATP-binding protein
MSQSAIVVQNLVKTFVRRRQAPIRAVDGLTFSVRRGSIFGLLGPNGAGKTTTLRVLTTLTKPTEGDVSVEGFDVLKHPLEVRRRISVVVQENAAELFLSVRDNLATFGRFHGLSSATIRSRGADVLEQFGLTAEAGRKVMDLSGGFKRRVQVAKVFMVDTPVVFLDEFSTGMDPLLKRAIMIRLRQEATRGRTIVLTTQILGEAEELCDDILIINGGRQAARGDVNTLKLLSAGLYDVTVTFDRLPDAIAAGLEMYRPLRVTTNQNTVVVTLKEQESRVVDVVGYLAGKGRVLRIEVSGASLEDVFVELTTAALTPETESLRSSPRTMASGPASGVQAPRD